MLGVAGATVGIIIAAGILLQCFSTRYIANFDRFRALTGEYRENHFSDSRKQTLQYQIANYGKQISHLNWASICVSSGALLFLGTVGVASLSVIFPHALVLRLIGSITLFGGLVLIAVALYLGLLETFFQRHVIGKETDDFKDFPSTEEALRK